MRLLLCCLALLVAVNASAQTEYWVALGSYQERSNAERKLQEAEQALTESFTLEPVNTEADSFYRLVAGPYYSADVAQHIVGEARRAGFEGAWMVTSEEDESVYVPSAEIDQDNLDPAVRRAVRPEMEDRPALDIPAAEEKEHKLIEEAPAGYKLNKLNRDQAALDPRSPFLLATTSPSVLAAALAAQEATSSVSLPERLEVDFKTGDTLVLQEWDPDSADMTIDGRLDEQPWREARAVNMMRVVEPEDLTEPPFATDVRLFYTQRGIYVSFDMEQPEETLVKRLSFRDARQVNRDYVSFTLDTSGEGRYGYWMNLALGDTQMDGTVLPERQYSSNWDGAWYGATAETERGWSAEFFIPWSQMSMPKAGGVRKMGFFSSRVVAHLNQRWGWPPYPRSQAKFMSVLQPLEVTNVNPRQQWSLFPYTSSTIDEVENDTSYKAGFDVFWRPSTNLQLTATANPDFGTVEADDVVVNLSAFETFFPEKRLFFLEGREIFQETPRAQASDGQPVTLLNTKRIGSRPRIPDEFEDLEIPDREARQLTELYGAGKVTGQVGNFRYGVMTAFEEDTKIRGFDQERFTSDGRDYGIARVLYENNSGGAYKALGGMSTVTAHSEEDAYTNGIDYHLLTASGLWKVDGQFLHSNTDIEGTGFGGFVDIQMTPRTGLKHKLEFSHYDSSLQINELGFLRRNDVTGIRLGSEWIKTGLTRIRDMKVEPFLRYEENSDGKAVRSGIGAGAEFKLNNLDQIDVEAKYLPERYDDRNSFGNGTYKIQARPAFELGYETDSSKKFSYFANASWEKDGVDGHFYETKAGVSWRPIDRLSLQVSTGYRVREGWLLHQEDRNMTSFDSEEWSPQMELDFFLSAKQQFKLAFQWVGIKAFEQKFYLVPEDPGDLIEIDKPDDESDDFAISSLNFQMRYRWQIAPLSDLFVVYTKLADDDLPIDNFSDILQDAWNDPLGEQLVVKLRYRLGS